MFQRTHPIGKAAFTECFNAGPGHATIDIVVAREPASDYGNIEPWWRGILKQPLEAPNSREGIAAVANLLAPHGILLDTSDDSYDALKTGNLFALPSTPIGNEDYREPRSISITPEDITIGNESYSLALKINPEQDRHAYIRQLRQENAYAVAENTSELTGCLPAIAQVTTGTTLGALAGAGINTWCALLGAGCGLVTGAFSAGMTQAFWDEAKARKVANYYQELASKNLYATERWDDGLAKIADEIKELSADTEDFDHITPELIRSFNLYRVAGALFNTQEHKPGLVVVYTAKDRSNVTDFFKAFDKDLLDTVA